MAIADIPLLYETGRQADFDRVVATVCSPSMQLARLVKRGLSADEARQRIAAQMSAEEKAAHADDVVHTDGTLEETEIQVREIWAKLLRAAPSPG